MNAHMLVVRRTAAITFFLLALMSLAGAQQQPAPAPHATQRGDDDNLPAPLAQVLRDYEQAWSAKDAKALANLFADDGFVLPNGAPPVRGRANIQQHYAGSGGPLHLRALAWAQAGDIGYIIGEFSSDPDFARRGKFTLTLTRDDAEARWLIMSDMDSGNTRPRPAPPQP